MLKKNEINTLLQKIFVFSVIVIITRSFATADGPQLPAFNTRLSLMLEPDRTFTDLVRTTGYESEDHHIITEDEYILTLHRIPGGPRSAARPGKPVVVVFSGIGANSDTWVLQGPRVDLAFMMVDEGYDVWYMNIRGTYYSKHHLRLAPNKPEFWNFSFHEVAMYDAAATIDYILKYTHKTELSAIGHSMGTTLGFVLLSQKPEYNKKINVFFAFAPVARLTQTIHRLWYFAIQIGPLIYDSLQLLRMYEVFPRSNLLTFFYNMVCERFRLQMFCQKFIYELLGIMAGNYDLLDPIGFTLFQLYFPEGIADNVFYHYRQLTLSGKFEQYDHGTEENHRRYNSSKPPTYPIEKISTHVVLYSGIADAVSNIRDTKWLHSQLQNSTFKIINYKQFHHLDFISCKIVKDVLYYDVIIRLNSHNPDHEIFKDQKKHLKI